MRLALITGGSKGLGLALCQTLLADHYRVMEFSRSAPHAYSVAVDLSAPLHSLPLISAALDGVPVAELQELLVINNHARLDPIGAVATQPAAAVLAHIATNFSTSVLWLAAVMARFQALPCRKVVANISSGAATRGITGWSLYCATKAGMEHYLRTLALEQQPWPQPFLAVNINPGVMDTDMQALIRSTPEQDFPDVDWFIERQRQGALAAPVTVARRIVQLLRSPSLTSGASYDAQS